VTSKVRLCTKYTYMLGTIVIEKYKKTERKDIQKALEILIVDNSQDWATAGLYCYWDYNSREILYIGLAVDLVERYRQHNGLIYCNKKNCKYNEIEKYFENNEYIGFSIVLQSALSQPINKRQRKKFNKSFNETELIFILGEQGYGEIKRVEGILLEAFRQKYGRFPLWNKMGGSVIGQKSFKQINFGLLKLLVTNEANKYVSRVSLRELADNPTFCRYEAYLHSIRISIFPSTETIHLQKCTFGIYTFDEICQTDYFKK